MSDQPVFRYYLTIVKTILTDTPNIILVSLFRFLLALIHYLDLVWNKIPTFWTCRNSLEQAVFLERSRCF